MWIGILLWVGYLALVGILVVDVVQSLRHPYTDSTADDASEAYAACPKCETRNRPTAKHCRRCGTKLRGQKS